MKTVTALNGTVLPVMGLGTWRMGEDASRMRRGNQKGHGQHHLGRDERRFLPHIEMLNDRQPDLQQKRDDEPGRQHCRESEFQALQRGGHTESKHAGWFNLT